MNLQRPEDCEVRFIRGRGWASARRHIDMMEKALDWGADLICIIGSDQTYPEDMLPRLVNRFKETNGGGVCCLVPFRGFVGGQDMKPFQPLAWRLESEGFRQFRGIDLDRDMMKQISPADGDLQRVHIIGTGVTLFHTDHLKRMKKPWCRDMVDKDTLRLLSDMDAQFIWRLQIEGGAALYVDTTLQVKHLNIFQVDETYQERFADWNDGKTINDICSQVPNREVKA